MINQFFKNHAPGSRVWIFQSSREFSEAEAQQAAKLVKTFVEQWTSHSEKVVADGAVLYNRFVVLVADESLVSVGGCSLDSSSNFIRQLEQTFSITLFDRLTIAYRENGVIKTAGQHVFQQLIENGDVNSGTIVFNNLVSTLKDFNEKWEIPLAESWHMKFFKVPV